jgi:hypothetical protein
LVYSRTQKAPNYTYSVPKELIRQDEGEKTYREKEIYDFVLKEKVIFDDLVCTKFEPLYQEVIKVVDVLENGPHGPREMSKEQHAVVFQKISDKIGS